MARTPEKNLLAQHEIAAAAAQAGEIAKEAAIQAPSPGIRKYTRTRRVMKRNQQHANLWLTSPGTLGIGRSAEWLITDNAIARGAERKDGLVERLAVGDFDGDDHIYLWASDHNNPDAFPIDRYKKRVTCNIAEYLFASGRVRPAGIKEKYDLHPADKLIDGLPALCIHLDKPTEKKTFDPSRKKKASGSKTPPPDNKTAPGAEVQTEAKETEQK